MSVAKFPCRVKHADLTAERLLRLKVSILDSLACAINSLGAPPVEACLAQVKEFGSQGGHCCTLIGERQANVVYTAFYNTALIRYMDFMDSYFAKGGLCHPSDNIGAILATSEYVNLSGQDFLTALAVVYQVESALTASAPFLSQGLGLTPRLPTHSEPDCLGRSALNMLFVYNYRSLSRRRNRSQIHIYYQSRQLCCPMPINTHRESG